VGFWAGQLVFGLTLRRSNITPPLVIASRRRSNLTTPFVIASPDEVWAKQSYISVNFLIK
ncbi:MAG: hypothetical protein ACP5QN_02890, partial [Minisyncoccia bacterium]